ncbi:uncharacterized protein LOC132303076 [Cornus florida]|uniref:uncharacterized protein LOC132303076 n=1 Tax=Cornus florida TaxID=4283 RepID=UPI00289D8358|nr:uncharacterized protein LOC132303076 [Cornus florida]
MPRYRGEPPAVRVYTVCDESKYLIVKNVPALGCGDELSKQFATYGDIKNVNQWMMKTVSHLPSFTGSNFVTSTMPGD